MPSNRRDFLRLSAAGAAAFSALGAGASLSGCSGTGPASGMRHLRPGDVALLSALVPAVMKGHAGAGDTVAIKATVRSFDQLLEDTSPHVIAGVLQAFDVLTFAPSRALLAGQWSGWENASEADAQAALDTLRTSGVELLNAVYAAVLRLVVSAWYVTPENSAATGYPGPPRKVAGVGNLAAPEPALAPVPVPNPAPNAATDVSAPGGADADGQEPGSVPGKAPTADQVTP